MLQNLVQVIVEAIVDKPEDVVVHEILGERTTVVELRVAQSDIGKVIGRQGKTATAIRSILNARSEEHTSELQSH